MGTVLSQNGAETARLPQSDMLNYAEAAFFIICSYLSPNLLNWYAAAGGLCGN